MRGLSSGGSIADSPIAFGYGLIASLLVVPGAMAGGGSGDLANSRTGYTYGQPMPVTCLNRTIDSGEHITDDLGKLQYIPFPTCSETFLPLALRYGVTETISCTIDPVPDELYHLLEYYVHSDVPMACRVPTAPLITPHRGPSPGRTGDDDEPDAMSALGQLNAGEGGSGPSYTPITFGVQGTLQRSHLHLWTDMNVLLHNIDSVHDGSSDKKKKKKEHKKKKNKNKNRPGFVVAGTAYSIPEFEETLLHAEIPAAPAQKQKKDTDGGTEKEAAAVAENARDPWTAGHGTKVVRGEPLTFTFHVSWVEGGRGIGWPSASAIEGGGEEQSSGFFSRVFFFALAASVGALAALYYERNVARRRGGWRGDGILGAIPGRAKSGSVGITYGNAGRMNGYGGYSSAGVGVGGVGGAAGSTSGVVGNGYGGVMSGKRD
ncbi:hypothetical protein P168DRAFT_328847 [Aspergillus campestris IBT 28561]|uniref:Uncharacterized protein n=1 Tax=Aspergillus campestris (strain IBT 28561) TaxID=1392248 RepID=A0A2I1CZ10_ASPC2|nr:uncharacterized protein P168DRAFT_328847 [Aspergillus campestris IBT 28561]PKY02873.1 hypothetical protein P168DRAFT_328847 [Aspergillus campestris IBT 28561]